jgi:hypothetical protein
MDHHGLGAIPAEPAVLLLELVRGGQRFQEALPAACEEVDRLLFIRYLERRLAETERYR